MSEKLQYPIGRMQKPQAMTASLRSALIDEIAAAPAQLQAALHGLSDTQLDTTYRPGGWTLRQVVHHVADSHINAYARFRWTLTEDEPMIKTYQQDSWASLSDARSEDAKTSLALLAALHQRWVTLLRSLDALQFQRKLQHSEDGPMTLDDLLCMYAWHGRHHVAHITSLRKRMGW